MAAALEPTQFMARLTNHSPPVLLLSCAVDLNLRMSRILYAGVERSLREHLNFVKATASDWKECIRTQQPREFVAAGPLLLECAHKQLGTTTDNLLTIAQETGFGIRSLVLEAMETFSPTSVTRLLTTP